MEVNSNDSIASFRDALSKAMTADQLGKAFTQSNSPTTGLTFYDLEGPAKTLYPQITPLRNMIPRVSGKGGTQSNWKAVLGVNTTRQSMGVAEGIRGRIITTSAADYFAAYKTLGLEDSVTFEAQNAGANYEDIKARATKGLLYATMEGEELVILGGNTSVALGTTSTPTLAQTTGGALADGAVFVYCVALTLAAYREARASGTVTGTITHVNAGGGASVDNSGCARASAVATLTVTSGGGSAAVTAVTAVIRGAVGYAWFVGSATGYANANFAGVSTINSFRITSIPGATGTIPADLQSNDRSKQNLVHDGFLALAANTGFNGTWYTMPTGVAGTGTSLTSDGAGGIVEMDAVLALLWENYRLSPQMMFVNSQEQTTLYKRILAGGGVNATQRFTFTANQAGITGSGVIKSYLNKYSMDGAVEIPIKLHPFVPPGTILFMTQDLPYPANGVTTVNRILTRQDYYQIEWPLIQRQWQYGVYTDQVMQCYAPFSLAVMANIAPG